MILKNKEQITEFEIQAELYMLLKNKWFIVRWEIVDTEIRKHTNNEKWFRQSRFDLVVFEWDEAKVIIEVKRPWKHFNKWTRQYKKYKMYNLPILCFNDLSKINDIIKFVYEIINK